MIRRSGPRSFVRSSSAPARYRYKSAFQLMGNSTTPRENAAAMIFLFTIKATVREAVASVEISKEKETAETHSRFARSGTGEIRRSQCSYVEERPTDLRSRHHRIR